MPTFMAKTQDNKIYVRLFWLLFASPFIFFGTLILLVMVGVFGNMPNVDELDNPKNMLASQIISADQKVLGTY
jgi:penicillin-binding protein 1A